MDLKRRLWLAIAELGMAFAGLVLGYAVAAAVLSPLVDTPFRLATGPLITAVAAVFYAKIGPMWAAAAREEDDDAEPLVTLAARGLPLPRTVGIVVLGILAALVGSVVLGLLFEQLGMGVEEQPVFLKIIEDAGGQVTAEIVVLAVSALVLAPVIEEWLFRGLLFTRVLGTSGRPLAYLFSAVGFAALHGNPAGFIVYLWLGLVFAAVLERTGRLWTAIAVHMGNNAYALAMLLWGGSAGA